MWLQVFIPTKQEHTRLDSLKSTDFSLQTVDWSNDVFLIGWNKNLQAHGPLWKSLDMPGLGCRNKDEEKAKEDLLWLLNMSNNQVNIC